MKLRIQLLTLFLLFSLFAEAQNGSGTRQIIVDKAYFHSDKTDASKRKGYLLKGDIFHIDKIEGNWVHGRFIGATTTEGWIKAEALSKTASRTNLSTNNGKWKGKWRREEWQNWAALEITSIKGDRLSFELHASNGGHLGDVEGEAYIRGNKATYSEQLADGKCVIEFEFNGESLVAINQLKGDCFAAMGVSYTGKYYNVNYTAGKKKEENTLYTLGLFSREEDLAIQKLVGEEYHLFVSSTQLTNVNSDLDGLNTKVRSSGIRGLFTFMEDIIMINSKNEIWAAVIDGDMKVLYYTNRSDYKNKLPKTIEAWRERFKKYSVIYKSAK